MSTRASRLRFQIPVVESHGPWYRMHLLHKDPVKFERQSLFRFDGPPEGFNEFETCYVGCSQSAAFLETLGALQPLPERLINERVITEVEHPGDLVPLADLTDDRVLRRLGLYYDPYVRDYVTDDMDRPGLNYSFTQNLARDRKYSEVV